MLVPVFLSPRLRIVCVSDTHNENPTARVPDGDIFIHAGDLSERGSTYEQYAAVVAWISKLPHRVKVVIPGNADAELDRTGDCFNPEFLELFTSNAAKRSGIVYLDRETRVIGLVEDDGRRRQLKVYGNPLQPEFEGKRLPFTYLPAPDAEAEQAWSSAPEAADDIPIWVMHGPPLGRLDDSSDPGSIGCRVQAKKIAEAKPLLCVFGHYHYSWGGETTRWDNGTGAATTETLALSEERRAAEKNVDLTDAREFDLSGLEGPHRKVTGGQDTVFVNGAWMTSLFDEVDKRNPPIVVVVSV